MSQVDRKLDHRAWMVEAHRRNHHHQRIINQRSRRGNGCEGLTFAVFEHAYCRIGSIGSVPNRGNPLLSSSLGWALLCEEANGLEPWIESNPYIDSVFVEPACLMVTCGRPDKGRV